MPPHTPRSTRRIPFSLLKLAIILLGLWVGFDWVARLVAESLWFQEVNYFDVFWLRLRTQAGIGTIVTVVSLVVLLGNLGVAQRLAWSTVDVEVETKENNRSRKQNAASRSSAAVSLSRLLPLSFVLGVTISLLLVHYTEPISESIGVTQLYGMAQVGQNESSSSGVVSLPQPFHPQQIWQMIQRSTALEGVAIVAGAIAVLIRPRLILTAGAIVLSADLGFILSGYWGTVLQLLQPTPFQSVDPLFHHDISFYIFGLPNAQLLEFWLVGVGVYGFVSVCLTYVLSGKSLSEGRFIGFSPQQYRHLSGLAVFGMSTIALSFWLSRYELLYSNRSVAYGASYTDAYVQLPVNTALSVAAVAVALLLLWQTLVQQRSKHRWGRHRLPILKVLTVYGVIAALFSTLLPFAIQRFIVQPNELARERPFIERSIAQTREAFNLNLIDVETFNPQDALTLADIQKNDRTIRNIRLWDTRPLLQTNRQLQQIRPYYAFPGADIDRYTLLRQSEKQQVAERQQVLIAARELDYNAVPQEAKTWVNEHLVYTHGYGFTISPVNRVAPGGLPDYFVKDITTDDRSDSTLDVSSEEIRSSIPIGSPRIYYGEISNTYVMTATKVKEFDYPSGNENVYSAYDGTGGIRVDSLGRRLLFAKYLNDWQMILTRNFTPDTKVLFRRNIAQRIRAIAPFLRYDNDPYLVVAKTGTSQNNLFWIIDAYTTSDRYPYSDPGQSQFNYIRNSVKVVVDAYNGVVNFYVADASDPIIQTWQKIFPSLFKSLDQLPPAIVSHLRYPVDLFNAQSDRLITYHMTDPQVFYNREDQWQVPNEIYGSKPQRVEPYYLITKLPTATSEEFILLLPYTPNQRSNLIAWLAARSDGQNYGKLLLYTFPKQELVFGTEQIEARINQDPIISQQISLWNRAGSRAIQGNLLVIPIATSLLYVEPIYLEAEQNSLPTLVRVVVAYENQIVMADTLDKALRAIFQGQKPTTPAVVRPIEEQR